MNDRGFLTPPERHLGKKIFLIGVIGFFVLLIGGYLSTTAWYFIQIKQGKKVDLQNPKNFTAVSGKNSLIGNRENLEGGKHPYRGKKDGAEVVIVEFLDYNCPNSRMIYDDLNKVVASYGNRAKVIFRQFPVTSIPGYEDSDYLSQIALCGSRQNRFPAVNDYLFANYDELTHPITEEALPELAAATGLQLAKLQGCLADPGIKEEVNKDYFDGVEAGVRGTPTFFINGEKVEGAVPFEVWKKYFDSLNP